MNYIKEINAFYDWLETNSISTSAIVLWHALMAINNKCGWITEFAVATSVLEIKTGLKRRSIERARNELEQKGRVQWKSRKGNQSALYVIVRFIDAQHDVLTKEHEFVRTTDAQPVVQHDAQPVVQHDAQPVAINKLNKTKQNDITQQLQQPPVRESSAYQLFQNNIKLMPTDPEHEQLADWITRLGDRFVSKAIEVCCKSAKDRPTYRFLEYLINDWISKGARTAEDIDRLQEDFRKKQQEKVISFGRKSRSNNDRFIPQSFQEHQAFTPEDYNPEEDQELQELMSKLKS